MIKGVHLVLFLLLFMGCSDNSIRTFYDKEALKEGIGCMKLVVMPPNKELKSTLESLYGFKKGCDFVLEVSQKSAIVCNSSYNTQKKALGDFPSSYLKLQLMKNYSLIYSYYIDLKHKPNKDDIKEAFEKLKEDIKL